MIFSLFIARKSRLSIWQLCQVHQGFCFLLTLSLAWFLFRYVQNLSEADFGKYKLVIGLVAIFIFFGSFALVKDFLAVRSLSILCLFYAREVLDSAWLQDPPARLFLVTITYILIVSALYFGAWPYRFRDFFEWLAENNKRVQILSVLLSIICWHSLLFRCP